MATRKAHAATPEVTATPEATAAPETTTAPAATPEATAVTAAPEAIAEFEVIANTETTTAPEATPEATATKDKVMQFIIGHRVAILAAITGGILTALTDVYVLREKEKFHTARDMTEAQILVQCRGEAMDVSRQVANNCESLLAGEPLTVPLSTPTETHQLCKEAGDRLIELGNPLKNSENLRAIATFQDLCSSDLAVENAPVITGQ